MKTLAFLTAEWRHLVMLNYAAEPDLLRPFVPLGTELDFFEGETFLSLVGFRFLRTRVLGLAFPFHTDFEEVNLRFYVRRRVLGEWRRGVVFLREIVPRRAIAFLARTFYGEPYVALPMQSEVADSHGDLRIRYAWKCAGRWHSLLASARGDPAPIQAGSGEEFITEHYWGYNRRRGGSCEYQVEHPRWRVWATSSVGMDCDVAQVYGAPFASTLSAPPASSFIADGSAVVVRSGRMVGPGQVG